MHLQATVLELQQYLQLQQVNRNMEAYLQAMKDAELRPLPAGGPLRDPMTRVDARLDWWDAHTREYEENRAAMRRVERALAAMDDPLERLLLRLRYTDDSRGRQLTWPEVTERVYGRKCPCLSTVHRHHRQALAHFAGRKEAAG